MPEMHKLCIYIIKSINIANAMEEDNSHGL